MGESYSRDQIEKLRICAVQSLQEYVLALQSNSVDEEERIKAEDALYTMDPENPLIQDYAAEMQKEFFEITMQNASVQYQKQNTKPMFEFPETDNIKQDCRFAGKCVLFTGFYEEEKEQIAKIADFLKITQPSGVCRKMDFLICGNNAGPSKIKKAEESGKPVIAAADFIREISKAEMEPEDIVLPTFPE